MSIKLTKKRNKILEVLKEAPGTLSASEIHKHIPDIDLVTIYRNLSLFSKEKLIKQVQLNAEKAQYEYQKGPHHHAICTGCKKVIHFDAPDSEIKKMLGLRNFKIDEFEMTIRGTCGHKNERGLRSI